MTVKLLEPIENKAGKFGLKMGALAIIAGSVLEDIALNNGVPNETLMSNFVSSFGDDFSILCGAYVMGISVAAYFAREAYRSFNGSFGYR